MKQKILIALGMLCFVSSAWAANYTLTLYADGCSSPNTFICSSGQQLSVSATPMAHRHFVQWNDGNTDNPRTVTMNQNYTYTATFAPDSFNISLSASPTSYGSVSGAGRYQYNSTVRLSATANYGYHFVKWSDGVTTNPRQILVESDLTLTANFSAIKYTITAEPNDPSMGMVIGAGEYGYKANVQLMAVANTGYEFVQWSNGETNNPYSFVANADLSIVAEFKESSSALEDITADNNATKVVIDGHIYIIRGNSIYNLAGSKVR